jgi:hypothetical protein
MQARPWPKRLSAPVDTTQNRATADAPRTLDVAQARQPLKKLNGEFSPLFSIGMSRGDGKTCRNKKRSNHGTNPEGRICRRALERENPSRLTKIKDVRPADRCGPAAPTNVSSTGIRRPTYIEPQGTGTQIPGGKTQVNARTAQRSRHWRGWQPRIRCRRSLV